MFDLVGAISHFSTICQFANKKHMFVHFINSFSVRISLVWDKVPRQDFQLVLKDRAARKPLLLLLGHLA